MLSNGLQEIDHQHRSILNVEGKDVANYKPSMINQIYHLKEATVKVSPDWLKQKSDSADMLTILKDGGPRVIPESNLPMLNGKLPNPRRQCKSL